MIGIAIMAHPRRAAHVEMMVERLRAQGADPRVSWDHDSRGPWFNWRRAFSIAGGDHRLVLQDDVRFCADLAAAVAALVERRPHQPISLFSPRESVRVARGRGHRWVLQQNFVFAQALVVPRELGERAIAWVSEHDDPRWGVHDDYRLGKAFRALGVMTAITVPNLVDHLEADSVLGHHVSGRVSPAYVGDDAFGADIDFSDLTHTVD